MAMRHSGGRYQKDASLITLNFAKSGRNMRASAAYGGGKLFKEQVKRKPFATWRDESTRKKGVFWVRETRACDGQAKTMSQTASEPAKNHGGLFVRQTRERLSNKERGPAMEANAYRAPGERGQGP